MNESNRRHQAAVVFAIFLVIFVVGRSAYQTNPDVRAWVDGVLGNVTKIAEITPQDVEKLVPALPESAEAEIDEVANATEEAGPIIPGLDIVRVEPSGDAVFAGRVQPGWDVELRANGEPIGQATANEGGEWAIVIDKPLNAGPSDVTLHAKSPDGAMTVNAPDRVAIDISEGRKSQPLVVVTSPDGPSDVVQTPKSTADLPKLESDEDGQSEEQLASGVETETLAETVVADDAAVTANSPADSPIDTNVDQPDVTVAAAQDTKAEGAVAVPDVKVAEAESEPATEETQVAVANDEPALPSSDTDDTETVSTATEDASQEQTANQETTFDVASDASPSVNEEQAETVESPADDGDGTQTDTATTEQTIVADQTEDATADETITVADTIESEASTGVSEPTVTIEAVENDTKGQLFVSGRSEPGEAVRAYSDSTVLGEAIADASGRWTVRSERPDSGSAQPITVRADLLNAKTGKPAARAQVSFERLDPGETIVSLIPVPTERAGSIPPQYDRLIVKRGDNLWRIARNLYGEGIRFTNIYIANQDQIRNPDLIFPGQVFAVPKRAVANEG